MLKLIIVMGANCTGKTYFINTHFRDCKADILNVYDYQQRAYNETGFGESIPLSAQFGCLMRANNLLLADTINKLQAGRDVVVEQTFYKAKRRIAFIDAIREALGTAEIKTEIYVMCPDDARWEANLRERRSNRSVESCRKQAAEEIEFPNPVEGFDEIYEVTGEKIRLRMDTLQPEIVDRAREELAQEAERIQAENEKKRRRRELIESMNTRPFWHYCEVCGKKEFITADEAFNSGWDYPPQMGIFGLLGPRKCGNCSIINTLYWKIHTPGRFPIVLEGELSPEELITWRRIKNEPESLLHDENSNNDLS